MKDCCILNGGGGAWAFAPLARQLSDALWLDVSEVPRRWNYLLAADDRGPVSGELFIPYPSILQAGDKRLQARAFASGACLSPKPGSSIRSWVVLEVCTDGLFNHVDRDLGIPELETEIQKRIAESFWCRIGPPWAPGEWSLRSHR